ncbi:unnamed protein product, partial [Nesidiocoris tenuis]
MVVYLNETVLSNKETIATIPLTMFTSAAVTSVFINRIFRVNNQKKTPAENMLLTIDPKVSNIPTVAMLAQLYDNYLPDAFMNEDVTPAEVKEEEEFMKAVLNTTAMSLTKSLLSSKGIMQQSRKKSTWLRAGFSIHLKLDLSR